MISLAELHMGQYGELSMPLSASKARIEMLKWQHCLRKHLILGKVGIFHTQAPRAEGLTTASEKFAR